MTACFFPISIEFYHIFAGHVQKSTYANIRQSDLQCMSVGFFKVIPWYCIAHPYCAPVSCHLRVHECVRIQNVRDFPQTKLDSKINAPFLLNEYGDNHFLFHNFNEDNISYH